MSANFHIPTNAGLETLLLRCSYLEYTDDVLAQSAQMIVFFSLLGSLITSSNPEDPAMTILLPGLLVVSLTLFGYFQVVSRANKTTATVLRPYTS